MDLSSNPTHRRQVKETVKINLKTLAAIFSPIKKIKINFERGKNQFVSEKSEISIVSQSINFDQKVRKGVKLMKHELSDLFCKLAI